MKIANGTMTAWTAIRATARTAAVVMTAILSMETVQTARPTEKSMTDKASEARPNRARNVRSQDRSAPWRVRAPEDAAILSTLRKGHPRLLLTRRDLTLLKKRLAADPSLRRLHASLLAEGRRILDDPGTVEYRIVGPRLLAQSRMCLDRVTTLATLYRLDGDRRWADRALREIRAAAAFPDWNPSHFLDTAEMTHAFALAYDWLHDLLSPEDRALIRTAIVEKGLLRGKEAYEGTMTWKWWTTADHNWNQVCNGGMIMGALAVAGEEPELASFILASALRSLPRAMASFAPDGGWSEGPGYWAYTLRYTVPLLAALESALGSDFGLSEAPGFDRTGTFRLYFVSPIGRTFNYADAGDGAGLAPEMRWLARRFRRPIYHWEADRAAGEPDSPVRPAKVALDMIWHRPARRGPKAAGVPLDAFFRGVDVAFLRSEWENPNAIFVGIKGGDNAANHSHLDLGTFVLDALGERWGVDLGGDDYNLPDYFGQKRWSYYRLRTEGQNTLLLDGENQPAGAKAPIVAFLSRPGLGAAVIDLTEGYAAKAARVRRGVALVDGRRSILFQDEIDAREPVEVLWAMHTPASIEADGPEATLNLGGKRMKAAILEPEGALFASLDASPPPPENPNRGIRRLAVRLPRTVRSARLAIRFTPVGAGSSGDAMPDGAAADLVDPIQPLGEWIRKAGPLPETATRRNR